MKSSTSQIIRLGVFVTIGVTIFTIAVYLIGQKQNLFSDTFVLRARFNNVNGLQPGHNVRFSGITVGSVIHVTILNDSTIEVGMRIKESVRQHIKKDALASIGTDGLMGNMLVNILPGKVSGKTVDDNDLITSYSRIKTDDILNTLNVTNENAALLTFDLLEITQQIKRGQGTVSAVLYDSNLRDQIRLITRNLLATTNQVNQMLVEFRKLTHEVDQGRGTIGWLLNDTLTAHQVRNTLTKLELTGQKLQAVSDSVQFMVTELKAGKGTLHTLTYDTIVANDLKKSMQSIREGTEKFNENMEALKHSAFLRKYFKEQEKQKK